MTACKTRDRLLLAFKASVQAYAVAVTSLTASMGTMSRTEYDAVKLRVEQARIGCEAKRLVLERHTIKHWC